MSDRLHSAFCSKETPTSNSQREAPLKARRGLAFYALPCLQILGLAGVFLVLWLSLFPPGFAGASASAVAAVAGALICVVSALLLWSWSRVGGYTAHWMLRQWVRDGPLPRQVSLSRRLRFLKPLADMSAGAGWLYFSLALVYVILGGIRALESVTESLGHFTVAAVWLLAGGYRILFTRKWGQRATELYNETLTEQASQGDTPE
ncbi:hypothetical protein EDF39_1071 [Frondihabitans sp. PhB161]|jgi:hypothetical protein|nr:hypothetical protein EDF37_1069 [Frondihabitans sp. PhB153]RPF08674.1 hypothetical protein EDF39_1071 [Frondihabitans sp. PhB161]